MQRQYRLIETLIIAFAAGAVASVSVAIAQVNADNWKALVPGILTAAMVAGGKALMVAWTNYGGTP